MAPQSSQTTSTTMLPKTNMESKLVTDSRDPLQDSGLFMERLVSLEGYLYFSMGSVVSDLVYCRERDSALKWYRQEQEHGDALELQYHDLHASFEAEKNKRIEAEKYVQNLLKLLHIDNLVPRDLAQAVDRIEKVSEERGLFF